MDKVADIKIGTPAGFKSELAAGFLLECLAGFVGIRTWLGVDAAALALVARLGGTIAAFISPSTSAMSSMIPAKRRHSRLSSALASA